MTKRCIPASLTYVSARLPSCGYWLAAAVFIVLCAFPACVPMEQLEAERQIQVMRTEIVGRNYDVLGYVEYPGPDYISLVGGCDEIRIRREAYKRFGTQAEAVIDFKQWRDGSQERCSGVAIRYR